MRIGFDARFLTHPQAGGFKTYVVNLTRALVQVGRDHELVLYVDRAPAPEDVLPAGGHVTIRVVPGTLPAFGMPLREQVSLVRQASVDRLDVFHAPCLTAPLRLRCPLVLTLHDTFWRRPPAASRRGSLRRSAMRWYYRVVTERAARQAAVVLTVSEHVRRDLVAQLRLDAARVVVAPEAAGPPFDRPSDVSGIQAVRRRLGLESPFVLALGSADPRKNLPTLIDAHARLSPRLRTEYMLALVCADPGLEEKLGAVARASRIGDRIRFLHDVDDDALAALYHAAALFAFPSLAEGFGLPVLEAMACGTPVVAGDNTSIPEVAGDAARLVDARDPVALAGAMTDLLTDEQQRVVLVRKGLARAAAFSWHRCAQTTLDAYRMSVAGGGPASASVVA